jgi:PEP-CTERM motif
MDEVLIVDLTGEDGIMWTVGCEGARSMLRRRGRVAGTGPRGFVGLVGRVWAVLVLIASVGHAALIQGEFVGIVTRSGAPFAGEAGTIFSGRYTYDDSATAVGAGPGSFLEGTLYPGLSFSIDGSPVGGNIGIVIIDGIPSVGADGLYVLDLDNGTGFPALGLSAAGSLWSGEALSVLDGRVFSDFSGGLVSSSPGPSSLPSGTVTSWSQSVVPEPGTAVLLMFGMACLAARRWRPVGAGCD